MIEILGANIDEEEEKFLTTFSLAVIDKLGAPLPADEHSVSVSLPEWKHVVGYEEGDRKIIDAMTTGYPRFRVHDNVIALQERLIHILQKLSHDVEGKECMVFPSVATVIRFHTFMSTIGVGPGAESYDCRLFNIKNLISVAVFPVEAKGKAKAFWQHTGEIVSSRLAAEMLVVLDCPFQAEAEAEAEDAFSKDLVAEIDPAGSVFRFAPASHPGPSPSTERERDVRERISALTALNASRGATVLPAGQRDEVQLTVCGMASIYLALRIALRAEKQARPALAAPSVVVFGFSYVDTLKMMTRAELNPGGAEFLGLGGPGDLQRLEEMLEQRNRCSPSAAAAGGGGDGAGECGRIAAIFTEFPSNPLLKCPDLRRLSSLAAAFDCLLVVDDTISGFSNVDLFRSPGVSVDVLCSSLTKLFNGRGNALGGSLVVNRSGRHYGRLLDTLTQLRSAGDIPSLHDGDLKEIEFHSRSYLRRSDRINVTALQLALWLQAHPLVEKVYYPGIAEDRSGGDEVFESVQRRFPAGLGPHQQAHRPGFGCLLSFVLRPAVNTQAVHDALRLNKGPSLGTDFSLLCPYTLLAHYNELPWAAQFGVPARLLRLSVGLEGLEWLVQTFQAAFDQAHSS